MKSVSDEYKKEMKYPFRNPAYINITLGSVDGTLHDATATSDMAYFANGDKLTKRVNAQYQYATCEEKVNILDGSLYFSPKEDKGEYVYQGAVSENVGGAITITFSTMIASLNGFSIDFTPYYPTEFTINDGTNTHSYTNNSQTFTTTDMYTNVTSLTITPTTMLGGSQRLRIAGITSDSINGKLVFDNDDILDFSWTSKISPISAELPTIDCSFTVANYDGDYDITDDSNILSFIRSGCPATVTFDYELDDGTLENVSMGIVYLYRKKQKNNNIVFTARDILATSNVKYSKGVSVGTGNGALASVQIGRVLDVMGISGCTVSVGNDVNIDNDLPNDYAKNDLQLLANASQSCLTFDDNAKPKVCVLPTSYSYRLTRDYDVLGEPELSREQDIREVKVVRTQNTYDTTMNEVVSDTVTVEAGTDYIYDCDFDEAYATNYATYDVSCADGTTPTITISDRSSHHFTLTINNATSTDVTFTVKSYKVNSSTTTTTVTVDEEANDTKTITNPVIRRSPAGYLHWVALYYRHSMEFTIQYRGDPAIEVGDIVRLERADGKTNEMRIYKHTLNFNGAWSGTIWARRCSE